MKPRKLNISKIRTGAYIALTLISIVAAVYLFFFYNHDAYERQSIEESLADDFIMNLIRYAENEKANGEGDIKQIPIEMPSKQSDENTSDYKILWGDEHSDTASEIRELLSGDKEADAIAKGYPGAKYQVQQKTYEDLNYYQRNGVTYTPDYAVGYLFCVLEYPNTGIRRGVYSGDWADIYYDLDLWMATTSRPDYELGQTHIAIYGHNHTAQDLSFNNLKSASVGDEFTLYSTSGVYRYEVTRIFAEWRSLVTRNYVDNPNISSDTCYIITCGRDNFLVDGQSSRYKDFIVEGHLKEKLSLTEYAKRVYSEERNWRE